MIFKRRVKLAAARRANLHPSNGRRSSANTKEDKLAKPHIWSFKLSRSRQLLKHLPESHLHDFLALLVLVDSTGRRNKCIQSVLNSSTRSLRVPSTLYTAWSTSMMPQGMAGHLQTCNMCNSTHWLLNCSYFLILHFQSQSIKDFIHLNSSTNINVSPSFRSRARFMVSVLSFSRTTRASKYYAQVPHGLTSDLLVKPPLLPLQIPRELDHGLGKIVSETHVGGYERQRGILDVIGLWHIGGNEK